MVVRARITYVDPQNHRNKICVRAQGCSEMAHAHFQAAMRRLRRRMRMKMLNRSTGSHLIECCPQARRGRFRFTGCQRRKTQEQTLARHG